MASERENGGIRQAAILMASVDSQTARQLLQQMPPATAKAIRKAMVDLGRIDATEQRAVLAAFQARVQSPKAKSTTNAPHSNSSYSRDEQVRQGTNSNNTAIDRGPATGNQSAFAHSTSSHSTFPNTGLSGNHWDQYSADQLIEVVTSERPTVIAVVLSQLQPLMANQVLAKLHSELRKEVLVQISRLQQVEGEIIDEIKEQLHKKLALTRPVHYADQELGPNRLKAILEAGDERMKVELCEAIEESSELTGSLRYWVKEQLSTLKKPKEMVEPSSKESSFDAVASAKSSSQATGEASSGANGDYQVVKASQGKERGNSALPRPTSDSSGLTAEVIDTAHSYVDFEDLKWLALHQLAQILQNCEPRALLVALSTADDELLQRVAMLFSKKDWKRLNERLQSLGPVDDEDRLAARMIVAEAAQHLLIGSDFNHTANTSDQIIARAA